jgi:outer membrane lipoprotein-sorting protein
MFNFLARWSRWPNECLRHGGEWIARRALAPTGKVANMLGPARSSSTRRGLAVVAICVLAMAGWRTAIAYSQSGRSFSFAGFKQVANGDAGLALLTRMLEADRNLTTDGDQMTTLYRAGRWFVSTQHVVRDREAGLKIEYFTPPRMNGSVLIDDGTTVWHYIPSIHQVQQSPSRIGRREQRVQQLLRAYRRGNLIVSVTGSDTIAGRACTIVSVRHKSDPGPWRIFWVDNATGFPFLKVEQHARNGQLQSVTQYSRISFDVPIPPGTFATPAVPSDVTVRQVGAPSETPSVGAAAQQAGFTPLQPVYLPPGYRLVTTEVEFFRRKPMIVLRYVSGLNTLSMFQIQSPVWAAADGVKHPRAEVATTVVSGIKVILVGNMPRVEMDNMLTSLR